MDWLTIAVEIIGGLIVVVWAIVPVMEFRGIFRKLKARPAPNIDQPDHADSGEQAFPVIRPDDEGGGR